MTLIQRHHHYSHRRRRRRRRRPPEPSHPRRWQVKSSWGGWSCSVGMKLTK